ncbi:endonuclease III [Thermincola ferriacetica]
MAADRVQMILQALEKEYGDAGTALNYRNPFELLVATVLSAQCTDERVNKVTPALFAKFGTPEKMSKAPVKEVEELIKSCGLYHNKARNLVAASKKLVAEFKGQVPDTLQELMSLPGVGRKTANVVLSNAFARDAIAVDTHVFRVANRLGLADSSTPLKTEADLMRAIPRDKWSRAHHWLIHHGRKVCKARNPQCVNCCLAVYCKSRQI